MKKAKGLTELSKLDYRARLANLTNLGDKKMIEHRISNRKVGKVPVDDIVEYAEKKGLHTFEHEGRLFVAVLQRLYKGPLSQ
jgi:hypothetical protein